MTSRLSQFSTDESINVSLCKLERVFIYTFYKFDFSIFSAFMTLLLLQYPLCIPKLNFNCHVADEYYSLFSIRRFPFSSIKYLSFNKINKA